MNMRLITDYKKYPYAHAEEARALMAAMKEKNQRLGYASWLPPLRDCTAVWVFEDAGKIVGGFAFKRIEEFIVAGNDPRILHEGFRHERRIRAVLAERGATDLIGAVPLSLMERRGRPGAMALFMKRLKMGRIKDFVFHEGHV